MALCPARSVMFSYSKRVNSGADLGSLHPLSSGTFKLGAVAEATSLRPAGRVTHAPVRGSVGAGEGEEGFPSCELEPCWFFTSPSAALSFCPLEAATEKVKKKLFKARVP